MKRAITFSVLIFAARDARAQVHLRAGAGGEIGPVVHGETFGPSSFGFMTGPTGKIGADFVLNAKWVGAVYWDSAFHFVASFDNSWGNNWFWWNHVAFELRHRHALLAVGPGIGFYCYFNARPCLGGPGPALMGRIAYEVVAGAHNAISLGLTVRFLFNGPPPPFNGVDFNVTPAFAVSWEHQ